MKVLGFFIVLIFFLNNLWPNPGHFAKSHQRNTFHLHQLLKLMQMVDLCHDAYHSRKINRMLLIAEAVT
jgi:hypothetical protein